MLLQRCLFAVFLLTAPSLSALTDAELYEYGRYDELLQKTLREHPSNDFLIADLLTRKGDLTNAVLRYQTCTNDPVLRDYAFWRCGSLLSSDRTTNGFSRLDAAAQSRNFFVAYSASVEKADLCSGLGRPRDAYRAWTWAGQALNRAPSGTLIPYFGHYFETRVMTGKMTALRAMNDPTWVVLGGRILAQSAPMKGHPCLPAVLAMMTNAPLRGWTNTFHTGRHLAASGSKSARTIRLLEASFHEARGPLQVFQSYEQLYGICSGQETKRLETYTHRAAALVRGTRFQDGVTYYEALRLHNDRRTNAARILFYQVLTNRIRNADIEARTAGFLIERPELYLRRGGVESLFMVCRRLLPDNPDLSDEFFEWALREQVRRKEYRRGLAILTNLPVTVERTYFAAFCRNELGDASSALQGYRLVVRMNSSAYYTLRALDRIRDIHSRQPSLLAEDGMKSLALRAKFAPTRWPDASAAADLLAILSYDPGFRLSSEEAQKLFSLVPSGRTNREGVERIRFWFDRTLLVEGAVELMMNEPSSSVLLNELTDYFDSLRTPYPQIRVAENRLRLLSGGCPAYLFHHPAAAAAYPRWYEEEVRKYLDRDMDDPDLCLALLREESRFRWNAVSRSGARGLAQLMPFTFRLVMKSRTNETGLLPDIFSPDANIEAGMRFFRDQMARFRNPIRALAAYNAGPGAVGRWLDRTGNDISDDLFTEIFSFEETRGYIRKITVSRACYREFGK